jgi:hypothetical protein
MKIRNGFVSNSSSSSFLIALAEYPLNEEHFKKLIFGSSELFQPWEDYPDESYETKDCARVLYKKITSSPKVSFGKIFDVCHRNIYQTIIFDNEDKKISHALAMKSLDDKETNFDLLNIDYYDQKILDSAFKKSCEFFEKHKTDYLFLFEISDNDSNLEAALEHGDTFKNIDYIEVSNH